MLNFNCKYYLLFKFEFFYVYVHVDVYVNLL